MQISLVHLGGLFPRNRNVVMSTVTGMITVSFAVFAVFDALWDGTAGCVGCRTLFGAYSLILAASAALSFFVWPNEPFGVEAPALGSSSPLSWQCDENTDGKAPKWCQQPIDESEEDYVPALCPRTVPLRRSNARQELMTLIRFMVCETSSKSGKKLATMSLKKQLYSETFFLITLFFIVTSFWSNLSVASITTEVSAVISMLCHSVL